MAQLKENQLVFIDENQNEVLCDIIFTYDSEEFGKSYVFFTEVGSEDENGNREVGVASYVPTDDGIGELQPVTTDEEWEMIEEVFESFAEESENGCCCGCGCEDGECDCEDGECDCENGECDCEDDEHECCCHHHHHK